MPRAPSPAFAISTGHSPASTRPPCPAPPLPRPPPANGAPSPAATIAQERYLTPTASWRTPAGPRTTGAGRRGGRDEPGTRGLRGPTAAPQLTQLQGTELPRVKVGLRSGGDRRRSLRPPPSCQLGTKPKVGGVSRWLPSSRSPWDMVWPTVPPSC